MDRKVILIIFASLVICGFIVFEFSEGTLETFLFDMIPYNYTSYVSIPPSGNTGALGGYYKIFGKGTDFNFELVLSGAENYEDPLCYTKDGLKGNGKITSIKVTYETIYALLSGNFRKAMFNTKFSGIYNAKCAAWTANGNFSNEGNNITGKFKINGITTDWEGEFNLILEGNRIYAPANYILYPKGNKLSKDLMRVNKTYYL